MSKDAEDVDPAKLTLPEYVAVKLKFPTGRLFVLSVATPDALKVPTPSCAAPLKKLTVPSDEPVGAGDTVAVSVTASPKLAGDGDAASVVVVGVALTVRLTGDDVDDASIRLPE